MNAPAIASLTVASTFACAWAGTLIRSRLPESHLGKESQDVVRLGMGLNLLPGPSVYTLNKLLIHTQPAHLAAMDGRSTGDRELPTVRAAFVRRLHRRGAGLPRR